MNETIALTAEITETNLHAVTPIWKKNLAFAGNLSLKVLSFLALAVFTLIVAFDLIVFVKSLSTKNVTVDVLGIRPLAVLSGSMSPKINYGDMIVEKSVQTNTLKVGDVITYGLGDNVLVSHRILHIEKDNGTLSFITKGDANNVANEKIGANQIVGKCLFVIPVLGYISIIGSTLLGKIILIIAPLFIFSTIIQAAKFVKKARGNIRQLKIKTEKVL